MERSQVAVSPATASDLSDLESVEVPMTAVRIDADVAAENGYEVRTDAQGYLLGSHREGLPRVWLTPDL